jgi:hypothetical protein
VSDEPLWPAEVIDRLRVVSIKPPRRRRWRLIAEWIEYRTWLRADVSLNTAKTSGRGAPGDDDELIVEVIVADALLYGVGVQVSPRVARWLVSKGVKRW